MDPAQELVQAEVELAGVVGVVAQVGAVLAQQAMCEQTPSRAPSVAKSRALGASVPNPSMNAIHRSGPSDRIPAWPPNASSARRGKPWLRNATSFSTCSSRAPHIVSKKFSRLFDPVVPNQPKQSLPSKIQ